MKKLAKKKVVEKKVRSVQTSFGFLFGALAFFLRVVYRGFDKYSFDNRYVGTVFACVKPPSCHTM